MRELSDRSGDRRRPRASAAASPCPGLPRRPRAPPRVAYAARLASSPCSAGSRRSSPAGCRTGSATSARSSSATARRCAYLLLVTDRYPYSAPVLDRPRRAARARPRAGPMSSGTRPLSAPARRSCASARRSQSSLARLRVAPRSIAPCRATCRCHAVDVDALFGAALVRAAERYERFLYVDWALSQIACSGRSAVYATARRRACARIRGRTRSAPGCCSGCSGSALVWLAELPFSVLASGGTAATGCPRRATSSGPRRLVRARRDVPRRSASRSSSSWPRPLARRGGGSPAARVRAHRRRFPSPSRTSSTGTSRSRTRRSSQRRARSSGRRASTGMPLAGRERERGHDQANAYAFGLGPSRRDRRSGTRCSTAASRRRGRRRARPRDRAPLEQPHPEGDRLVRALCPPRRVSDARHAPSGRDGRAGVRAARAARRRGAPARRDAGAELDQPPDGGRGRLEGTGDDARPGRRARRAPLVGSPRDVARDPSPPTGLTCSSTSHPTARPARCHDEGRSASARPRRGEPARLQATPTAALPTSSVYSGPGPALGRRQPAALGADRAALDAIRGGQRHRTVPSPSSPPPRRPGPGTSRPTSRRRRAARSLDPDVARLVVARPVARGEDRGELVERQLCRREPDTARPARSAASRAAAFGWVASSFGGSFPFVTVIALASAPPTKKPLSNAWRMFRTSRSSFQT